MCMANAVPVLDTGRLERGLLKNEYNTLCRSLGCCVTKMTLTMPFQGQVDLTKDKMIS